MQSYTDLWHSLLNHVTAGFPFKVVSVEAFAGDTSVDVLAISSNIVFDFCEQWTGDYLKVCCAFSNLGKHVETEYGANVGHSQHIVLIINNFACPVSQ